MPIKVHMVLNTGFITPDGTEFDGLEEFGITDDMSDEEIEEILSERADTEMEDVSIGYSWEREE